MSSAAQGIIASIGATEAVHRLIASPGWETLPGAHGVSLASRTGTLAQLPREGAAPILCAFDGRLDARGELLSALGLRDSHAGCSDAALVAAAYERWGVESAKRFIGDFVFTLWDAREQHLWVVRDPVGVKQIFYDVGPTQTVASDLRVFDLASASVNVEWVKGLLDSPAEQSPSATAYLGIQRLPAGHYITVKAGGVPVVQRYRSIGEGGTATFRSAVDNAEHLREMLERGVRDRLRLAARPGVLVSGGVDSTAVACLASRSACVGHGSLTFVSLMFSRTPESDERHWQQLVWNHCGRPRQITVEGDHGASFGEVTTRTPLEFVEPDRDPNRVLTDLPLRAAGNAGCDVLLGGLWADQVFQSWCYNNPRVWLGLPLARKATEWPWFVPRSSDQLRRVVSGGARHFLRRDRLTAPGGVSAAPVAGQVSGRVGASRLAALDFLARRHGLTLAHPFLDVRILDFASRLRPEWLIERGHNKAVLRRAMFGVVPEPVRRRRSRTVVTGLTMAGPERYRASLRKLLQGGWLVKAGLLSDVHAVEALITPRSTRELTRLSAAVSVELWRKSPRVSGSLFG